MSSEEYFWYYKFDLDVGKRIELILWQVAEISQQIICKKVIMLVYQPQNSGTLSWSH